MLVNLEEGKDVRFRILDVSVVKELLKEHGVQSYFSRIPLAKHLSDLLEIDIPVVRRKIFLECGDKAILAYYYGAPVEPDSETLPHGGQFMFFYLEILPKTTTSENNEDLVSQISEGLEAHMWDPDEDTEEVGG